MIKYYWKQTWEMVRQNKLFTSLYVAGTALALAVTSIMAVVYYVKIAPVYPEVNRNRICYVSSASFKYEKMNATNTWAFSYKAIREWFYTLNNAEAVSAEYSPSWRRNDYVQPFDASGDFPVMKKLTDPAFFRIYQFRFIEGKPFTEADLASGIKTAVITDALARRIFGTDQGCVGKEFKLNYVDYRISGVVKSASYLTDNSFAQVYLPYSTESGYEKSRSDNIDYYGAYTVTILTASAAQEAALREEIGDLVHRYNTSGAVWKLNIDGYPVTHLQKVFQEPGQDEFSWWKVVRQYFIIILVLLLVPALNLSGMIAGRMDGRLSEMGIRKSFGASRSELLGQVVGENLILTLSGGLVGLTLAWLALYVFRSWIFMLFEESPEIPIEGVTVEVSGEMLFSPLVFGVALLLCVLLNLLSALIPAWNSLRKPIISSLNEKR